MIEKLMPDHILGLDGLPTTIMPDSAKLMRKINELVDAVNEIMTWRFETDDDSDDPKHEEPADPYAEQRQWIGCVCRFWYDNPNDTLLDYLEKIQTGKNGVEYYSKESGDWFPNCKPVLPTDNAIYKGGDNE